MTPDPREHEWMAVAAVLSPREQWQLLCWMATHPRAVLEDTTIARPPVRSADAARRPSLAYGVGLAVGTLWLVLKRWW